jgi:hypothetical protein
MGRVDADMLAWAESTMDGCGIPDGLPVVIVAGEVFEPAWRWQRAVPQSQASGTRKRYMRDVRRLVAYLGERIDNKWHGWVPLEEPELSDGSR